MRDVINERPLIQLCLSRFLSNVSIDKAINKTFRISNNCRSEPIKFHFSFQFFVFSCLLNLCQGSLAEECTGGTKNGELEECINSDSYYKIHTCEYFFLLSKPDQSIVGCQGIVQLSSHWLVPLSSFVLKIKNNRLILLSHFIHI